MGVARCMGANDWDGPGHACVHKLTRDALAYLLRRESFMKFRETDSTGGHVFWRL